MCRDNSGEGEDIVFLKPASYPQWGIVHVFSAAKGSPGSIICLGVWLVRRLNTVSHTLHLYPALSAMKKDNTPTIYSPEHGQTMQQKNRMK